MRNIPSSYKRNCYSFCCIAAHTVRSPYPGGCYHPKAFPFSIEYTMFLDEGTIDYRLDTGPPTVCSKNGKQQQLYLGNRDGYFSETEYSLQCLQDKRFPTLCSPEGSARAVGLLELALQSRTSNGERIECNF